MTRSIAHHRPVTLPAVRLSPLQSLARRLVLASLARLREGRLTVRDQRATHTFGSSVDSGGLCAEITIQRSEAWTAIAFGGSLGAGEAFMDGLWECDDLTSIVRLLLRNREALDTMDGRFRRIISPFQRAAYALQRNSRTGSRRNIAAHYDLSNDFFALFLDPTMTYSCAIFENGAETLEQASIEKLDRACRKLDLEPSDHLLEIGTGWGSMAMHAAREYGCRVTTTTLSREQAALARDRIRQAGLDDRIEVIEVDYRDLEGEYDKLVSIEMIEAVGADNYDSYFGACSRLLKPDGLMLLQSIVIRDQFFASAARARDWLKKYIFPGSCIPATCAIQSALTRSTDMRITHLEDIGPHYATTLRLWREAFNDRLDDVRELGFDERFIRMWNYYLCYCEGAFLERHCSDLQLLLARPKNRRAPYNGSITA